MAFEYIKNYYKVEPKIGEEILFQGKRKGVIVEDRGHAIGVNFYEDKCTVISSLHPTSEIEYLHTPGTIRKLTASQKRYQDFVRGEYNCSFSEYLGINTTQKLSKLDIFLKNLYKTN